jgi:hypothetical protein
MVKAITYIWEWENFLSWDGDEGLVPSPTHESVCRTWRDEAKKAGLDGEKYVIVPNPEYAAEVRAWLENQKIAHMAMPNGGTFVIGSNADLMHLKLVWC